MALQIPYRFVDGLELVRSRAKNEVLQELEEWLESELRVAELEAMKGDQYFEIYAEALRDVISKIEELRRGA